MPGWHDATKALQDAGKVKIVGIIQEQHPNRTQLFMQWKQMGWPIMVDSLNLLGVSAVPITMFIDEFGIIGAIRPRIDDVETFLEDETSNADEAVPIHATAPDLTRLAETAREGDFHALRRYADTLVLWGGHSRIGDAIDIYQQALEKSPDQGPTHFRLGVAFRKRYDSDQREVGDFKNAVTHWGRALDINPNQYIWRRRIQQYGPRLDKPYSFYDWVTTARKEIKARGEAPVKLVAEPGGAEFASPVRDFESTSFTQEEPDAQGRILRDEPGLIKVETIVVPAAVGPGETARVHVVFRPNSKLKAHWNNEVDDLVLFISPPSGWEVDNRYLTVKRPPQTVSQEVRKVEFELKSPTTASGATTLSAYGLYYVCEDVNGTCLYRRQDIPVRVEVKVK